MVVIVAAEMYHGIDKADVSVVKAAFQNERFDFALSCAWIVGLLKKSARNKVNPLGFWFGYSPPETKYSIEWSR
jgi:hypothetical protein